MRDSEWNVLSVSDSVPDVLSVSDSGPYVLSVSDSGPHVKCCLLCVPEKTGALAPPNAARALTCVTRAISELFVNVADLVCQSLEYGRPNTYTPHAASPMELPLRF